MCARTTLDDKQAQIPLKLSNTPSNWIALANVNLSKSNLKLEEKSGI